jgi:hypothetical protein
MQDYLPGGFAAGCSTWPPNLKRIADKSLSPKFPLTCEAVGRRATNPKLTYPNRAHTVEGLLLNMKSISRLVWIVPAILLVVAVALMPYGYYTFGRIVTCGSAALIAVVGFREQSGAQAWSILFSLIAVLFNPIIPIYLNRSDWFYLDLGTAGVFVAHLIFVRGLPSR